MCDPSSVQEGLRCGKHLTFLQGRFASCAEGRNGSKAFPPVVGVVTGVDEIAYGLGTAASELRSFAEHAGSLLELSCLRGQLPAVLGQSPGPLDRTSKSVSRDWALRSDVATQMANVTMAATPHIRFPFIVRTPETVE